MMYTVVWLREAEAQLAALWIRAANKEAMAGYAEQIERILLRNPADQGESRAGNVRIWFHRPISVLFQIDEAAKREASDGTGDQVGGPISTSLGHEARRDAEGVRRLVL